MPIHELGPAHWSLKDIDHPVSKSCADGKKPHLKEGDYNRKKKKKEKEEEKKEKKKKKKKKKKGGGGGGGGEKEEE